MNSKKLTPSEVLERQKARLCLQSEALVEGLEEHIDYMQHHIGTIIRNSAVDAVVSKTLPIIQSLLDKDEESDKTGFNRMSLLDGILDMIPLFMKGLKGWLARWVLIQVKKLLTLHEIKQGK